MRIAEAERLPLSGKLVVICATFLHDTYPIQRITETRDSRSRGAGSGSSGRTCGRRRRGSASSTWKAARAMPTCCSASCASESSARAKCASAAPPLLPPTITGSSASLTRRQRPRSAGVLRGGRPVAAASAGRPGGLERPGEDGEPKDVNDPAEWRRQVRNNLQTLREYRANWQGTDERIPGRGVHFQDRRGPPLVSRMGRDCGGCRLGLRGRCAGCCGWRRAPVPGGRKRRACRRCCAGGSSPSAR